jgi:hypothetical protein
VDTVQTDLTFKIFDLKGHELESLETNLAVKGVDKQLIDFSCIRKFYPNKNLVVQFEWKNGAGVTKKRTFSELPQSYTKADSTDFKLSITNLDPIKKTATVIIKNDQFARSCWLYSNILGVRFEDNFIDLLPGEHSIEIHYDTLPTIEQLGIKNL